MTGILFVDLGEVRTFEIKGTQSIGRDGTNDIVVHHPTVSRQHARIELIDGEYRLVDFNSRNGTRINGRAINGSYPLIDGARMRIGHVRAWFFSGMPSKLPRSVTNRDRGIVFKCACGQRLWSSTDTAGMAVTCGGCHKSIEVPGQSQAFDDSGGTVAGVEMEAEPGKAEAVVCGICHWPIEKTDHKHVCPSCHLNFHHDCWNENRGCSAYGCSQVNALAPKTQRPATPPPIESPIIVDDEAAEAITAPPPPTSTWAYGLLAGGVIGSLFGLLTFGAPAAIVAIVSLVRLLISRKDNKLVLSAAFLIALLGTAAGVMISRFWWMGAKLFDWRFFG